MGSVRAQVRSLLRTRRYTDHLDSAESVILSLALTIESNDASALDRRAELTNTIPKIREEWLVWPKMRATPVVLVVDDEEPIRIAVRRMLEGDGYRVIEAENGTTAVTLLKDDRTVHVLIADLEMPELAGEGMVRQLREKRPELRVLYVTGHVDRLFSERPVLRDDEAFVEKPFTSKDLLEAIALLLYGTFKRPK